MAEIPTILVLLFLLNFVVPVVFNILGTIVNGVIAGAADVLDITKQKEVK